MSLFELFRRVDSFNQTLNNTTLTGPIATGQGYISDFGIANCLFQLLHIEAMMFFIIMWAKHYQL